MHTKSCFISWLRDYAGIRDIRKLSWSEKTRYREYYRDHLKRKQVDFLILYHFPHLPMCINIQEMCGKLSDEFDFDVFLPNEISIDMVLASGFQYRHGDRLVTFTPTGLDYEIWVDSIRSGSRWLFIDSYQLED